MSLFLTCLHKLHYLCFVSRGQLRALAGPRQHLQSKILRKDNFPLRFMRAKFLHFFGSLNLKGVFEKCNGVTINVLAEEGQGSSLLK